jgi:hypothetical protein
LPVDPLLELAQKMVGWDDLIIQIIAKEGLAPNFAEMLGLLSPSNCGNMLIESHFCETAILGLFFSTLMRGGFHFIGYT